jgi:hypothetical protein
MNAPVRGTTVARRPISEYLLAGAGVLGVLALGASGLSYLRPNLTTAGNLAIAFDLLFLTLFFAGLVLV